MIATQPAPEPGPISPGQPALHIAGLAKSFGDTAAVRDVELSVPPGTFLGVVGPNGAGKTTLLSMAVGLRERARPSG
jgi:ABC-2 type transport system ATP-binding protein